MGIAMIRFRCPHCKKPLQVKDHLAGKKAACPTCKKAIVIPKPAVVPPDQGAAPVGPSAAEIEEQAAAAFTEEPVTNGKQAEAPATIDFTCEFCEAEIH